MSERRFSQKNTDKFSILLFLQKIDIVLRDELMGFYHGSFGFVAVLTFRKGHELPDADQYLIAGTHVTLVQMFVKGFVLPCGAGVCPQEATRLLEQRPMGRVSGRIENLVGELMGNFVEKHLAYRIPGVM